MKILILFSSLVSLIMSQTSYSGNATVSISSEIKRLKLNLDNGYIHVTAWEKAEIEIHAYQKNRLLEDKQLKFILMSSGKTVQLHPEDQSGFYSYDIYVPLKMDLDLTIHDNGYIRVNNSAGEIEANSSSGNIRLSQISGSAVINSQTGTIFADFKSVSKNQDLAFSNAYGSIYLAFPDDTKATFNVSTVKGDAYSDFELTVRPSTNMAKQTIESNYLPLINGRISGDLNGGGVLIPIHTLSGDIYIEKLLRKTKGASHAFN